MSPAGKNGWPASSACPRGLAQVVLVARQEFTVRFRSGWVIACALVWLGAVAFTSLLGLVQIGRIGLQGYERTTVSLLNLVQYLVPLLGLLVGHDLIVRDREERTLHLMLATGLTRTRLLLGKFIGGGLTVAVPLVGGFAIAGAVIGLAVRDRSFAPFLKLALSGLILGVAFCALGLLLSAISRSRIQALVLALLSWGIAIFAFDLIALGVIVSSNAVAAAQEIEVVCDATHVNSQADVHAAFDGTVQAGVRTVPGKSIPSHGWIWLNPVDAFRVMNLPGMPAASSSVPGALASVWVWLTCSLGLAGWRLNQMDL